MAKVLDDKAEAIAQRLFVLGYFEKSYFANPDARIRILSEIKSALIEGGKYQLLEEADGTAIHVKAIVRGENGEIIAMQG